MMLRQLLFDLRRSPALVLGLTVAVVSTIYMVENSTNWIGRWVAMTVWLRGELVWVVSICAGFAAWSAGLDRRRKMAEFVATTPRPRWHIALRSCVSLSLCAMTGYLIAFLVAAVFVGRTSTYGNGHWIPLLVVGALSAVPACAFGYAVGQRVKWILVAPVTIAIVATLISLPKRDTGRWALLDTTVTESWGPAGYLQWRGHLGQLMALAGFAAGFLIIGSCRRWWISSAPIGAGLVAALLLFGSHPTHLWRPDQTARQIVCHGGTPEFCTTRENGYELAAVAPELQKMLAPLAGLNGVPRKFTDPGAGLGSGQSAYFIDQEIDRTGQLADRENARNGFLWNLHYRCQKDDRAGLLFQALLTGQTQYVDSSIAEPLHRLRQLPKSRQRELIREFFTARTHCDPNAGRFLL